MPTAVLIIWPIVAIGIFKALGPARGLIWVTGIGYLFLPEFEAFAIPGFPPYGKRLVISLALVLGALFTLNQDRIQLQTRDVTFRVIMMVLFSMIFIGIVGTILDNQTPLIRGDRFQAGYSMRDMVRLSTEVLVTLVPFLLARRWLADPAFHVDILKALLILGLVYSVLVMFEARMSPQLNRWVYDFFPHAWRQHIRGGGYRAIVFLSHGLSVGFFLFMAATAGAALFRHFKDKQRMIYLGATLWLMLVLVLSRNLGATLMAVLIMPIMLIAGRRLQVWTLVAISVLFLSYPMSRASLPTERFVSVIASFAPKRAESMGFRLRNEDELLARAREKPVFGWGGWGRGRIIDEKGNDLSVTDGGWIIRFGEFGWVGYIGYFGLAAMPAIFLRRRPNADNATIGLGVIVAGALFYTIPNSEMRPLIWLLAGALAGYVQSTVRREPRRDPRQRVYSRFGPNSGAPAPVTYTRDL